MSRLYLTTAALCSGLLCPRIANADREIEVGGFLGLHLFSDTNELGAPDAMPVDPLKDRLILGVRGGYRFHRVVSAELELGVIPTSSKVADASVTAIGYRLQVLVHPTQFMKTRLEPFGLLGLGGMSSRSSNTSAVVNDSDFVWHVGLGAKYRIGESWGLRGDLRLLVPPADGDALATVDGEILIGAYKTFGGTRSASNDQDHDGISDRADACPTIREDGLGALTTDGCPESNSTASDSDNDGVLDTSDRCPAEPETRNGYEDDDGCPDEVPQELQKFTGALRGVEFATGSDRLTPGSSKVLDDAVIVLNKFPKVRFEISGHTDNVGDAEKNRDLSKRRAEAVKKYLVNKGVDGARLEPAGYGPDRPLEDNATPAGRSKNRRVEFKPL